MGSLLGKAAFPFGTAAGGRKLKDFQHNLFSINTLKIFLKIRTAGPLLVFSVGRDKIAGKDTRKVVEGQRAIGE